MKKTSSKHEAKNNNLYNIFNDLMEYELDCKLNFNVISDNSDSDSLGETANEGEEDAFFYKDDKINSVSPPLSIEAKEEEEEPSNLQGLTGDVASQDGDGFSRRSKSLSYPPGFEKFFPPLSSSTNLIGGINNKSHSDFERHFVSLPLNQTPSFFNENTKEFFIKPQSDFVSLKTATSLDVERPSLRDSDKKVFFKKKYPYNNFRPWPPINYDTIKTELNKTNSVKSEADLIHKQEFESYESKKNIPTKKFYFGEMYKGMKCIKSFGIILFLKDKNIWRINNDTDIKYLLYQRRDTYAFMDFMRGLWNNESKMTNLLMNISKDEHKRLLSFTFDELWDDLWVSHSTDINGIYIARKDYAKKKYTSVYEQMISILNNKISEVLVCDAPWGFPKGKKNSKESDIECAKREFLEETQLDLKDINILYDLGTIIENYVADNGRYYTTFYYIAEVPKMLPIKYITTPGCIRKTAVSDEVANLIWSNYLDSKLLLDSQKLAILDEAHKRIVNK